MLFCFGSLLQGDYDDDDVVMMTMMMTTMMMIMMTTMMMMMMMTFIKRLWGGNQFWMPDNRADVSKLPHPPVAFLSL